MIILHYDLEPAKGQRRPTAAKVTVAMQSRSSHVSQALVFYPLTSTSRPKEGRWASRLGLYFSKVYTEHFTFLPGQQKRFRPSEVLKMEGS